MEISKSSVNNFRTTHGILRAKPETRQGDEPQRSGGGELLTGLALASGIIDVFSRTIVERVEEIRQSEAFLKNQQSNQESSNVREHGKFTKAHNQLQSVRENRFKSIDEKIPTKNYAAMKLFSLSEKVIARYNLALLCLPLVTSNGKTSRVNRVKGNALEFLCGYNYKDATLDKLGRVMNCLENVFIHDGKGHPLYFQTFHGHADLGKHALRMMTELTTHCDEHISVNRILVFDGAGNSVKTMRAFQESDEYFMTILDKNQVKERRVKHLGQEVSYPQGEATVVDCQIE